MTELSSTDDLTLPEWAVVTPRRRAHIARVTGLLDAWAAQMGVDAPEAAAWHDAGRWHDALRDATPDALQPWAGADTLWPAHVLHGPAAAARLRADGERREDVLAAIHWHTLGSATWSRTGRALYMADFLEPGRAFAREERDALAARVPHDFAAVFRRVVQWRLEWTVRDGKPLFPPSVDLWNAVR